MTEKKSLKDQLNAKAKKDLVIRLGDDRDGSVPVIPTGNLALNIATGGIGQGRIVEIFGGESTGKSSIAVLIAAQIQKLGLECLYIDLENTLDPRVVASNGGSWDDLLLSQPSTAEETFELIHDAVECDPPAGLIVVDSLTQMVPQAELEGDMTDSQVGLMGRIMAKGLRKFVNLSTKTNSPTVLIFINQLRDNISPLPFAAKHITPGGRALKFYASQRIELARIKTLTEGTDAIGHRVQAKVVKNKIAPPFAKAEFDIYYNGLGVSNEATVFDVAVAQGLLKVKGGGWTEDLDGTRLGQGKPNVLRFLQDNPEYLQVLESKILGEKV
jgi:recombination protein RecA